jgi:hypothetical protein
MLGFEKIFKQKIEAVYMSKLRNLLAAAGIGISLLFPDLSHANDFSVEAGITTDAALVNPKNQKTENNVLFQTLGAKMDIFKYAFIGGSMTAFEVPQTDTLAPWVFYSDIKLNAGFQWNNLKLEYEHGSQHPVTPYGVTLFDLPDGFQDTISLEYQLKLLNDYHLSAKAGLILDAALIYPKSQEIYNNVLFESLEAKLDFFKYFFIGGKITAFESPSTSKVFYFDWKASAGIQFENLKLSYEYGSNRPETSYGNSLFSLGDGFKNSFSLEYKAEL